MTDDRKLRHERVNDVYWKRNFCENHGCNFMEKYNITVLFRQFTKTLNQFLFLSRGNKHFEIRMSILLMWSEFNCKTQSILRKIMLNHQI